MTDPGLVAALAEALDEAWVTEDGGDSEQFAAAILPAFLADPRTHEWLAERLHYVPCLDEIVDGDHWPDSTWCKEAEMEWATAILGREP